MINKKTLIPTILFLLVATSYLAILLLSSNKTPGPVQNAPILTVTPTQSVLQNEPLKITTSLPDQSSGQKYPPIQQVGFVFNHPVIPDDFIYNVVPYVKTSIRQEDNTNEIILSTDAVWTDGITTITVTTQTKDINGKNLPYSYIYNLNAGFPAFRGE